MNVSIFQGHTASPKSPFANTACPQSPFPSSEDNKMAKSNSLEIEKERRRVHILDEISRDLKALEKAANDNY
jgi:hypothetical protein